MKISVVNCRKIITNQSHIHCLIAFSFKNKTEKFIRDSKNFSTKKKCKNSEE